MLRRATLQVARQQRGLALIPKLAHPSTRLQSTFTDPRSPLLEPSTNSNSTPPSLHPASVYTDPTAPKPEAPIPLAVRAIYHAPLKRPSTHNLPVCHLQIRSFTPKTLEFFCDFALRAAYYLHLPAHGPVPLPRWTERWTVPKSNFVHKKAQQNFERVTYRRLISITDADPEVVLVWLGFLRKHEYYGIGMKANVWRFERRGAGRKMAGTIEEGRKRAEEKGIGRAGQVKAIKAGFVGSHRAEEGGEGSAGRLAKRRDAILNTKKRLKAAEDRSNELEYLMGTIGQEANDILGQGWRKQVPSKRAAKLKAREFYESKVAGIAAEEARVKEAEAEAVLAKEREVEAAKAKEREIEAARIREQEAEAARIREQELEAERKKQQEIEAAAAKVREQEAEAARLKKLEIEAEAARVKEQKAEAARLKQQEMEAEAARLKEQELEAARVKQLEIEAEAARQKEQEERELEAARLKQEAEAEAARLKELELEEAKEKERLQKEAEETTAAATAPASESEPTLSEDSVAADRVDADLSHPEPSDTRSAKEVQIDATESTETTPQPSAEEVTPPPQPTESENIVAAESDAVPEPTQEETKDDFRSAKEVQIEEETKKE